MNFANIGSLFFILPLLALPVIIHIMNKKFPQRVKFSDISLIKKSLKERSKLFRLRHIILLCLRTIIILFILFCFLQPLLNKFGSDAAKSNDARNIIILFDNTLSMQYKGGGITPKQQELVEVEKIVDSSSSKDKINLITIDHQTQTCFDEPSINHNELLAYANSLKDSLNAGNMDRALAALARQIRKVKSEVEVYVISDFQRSNFSEAKFNELTGKIKLFFVDVSINPSNNRAITGVKIHDKNIIAGKPVTVDVHIANNSDKKLEDRLEILLNDKQSFFYDVKAEPWSVLDVRVSLPVPSRGIHFVKAMISPDDLPQDNNFYFNLNATDKEEIALICDAPEEITSTNYLIQAALNPYRNKSGSLLPKVINSQNLNSIHLATTNKIFISSTNRLSSTACRLLSNFMSKGGSVIYFLDGDNDAINLKNLEKELPSQLPFTASLKLTSSNLPGGRIQIRSGHFKSKYLKLFRGEARKRLSELDFYEYYQATPGTTGKILLNYAEGTPAMATVNVGFGNLLLCNFSIRESGSNISAQKIFPAWIHEI
ncbi:MAG: BatA domain-containing protein, partial [Lentisphaeraceae bacterium]|nr:BatA domain-containing protein [Lentisphaeraceae bacterium]